MTPGQKAAREGPTSVWSTVFLISVLSLLVLVLSLAVSGRIADFGAAFENFITQLFRIPAVYLKGLHADLKAFAADTVSAARFLGAILCLVVAIGVAYANYEVLSFSFQLLLPVGTALTGVALSYVALKAVAGVMLDFLGKGPARQLVIVILVLSTLCSTVLAYQRALALSEANAALQSSERTEAEVKVNGDFVAASPAVEPTNHVNAAPSNSGGPLGMFSREAGLVAAIALVIDLFELLCVFGALRLSTAGVVSFVCLPVQLPLTIARNTFYLIDQTSLAQVFSIIVKALLETPKIIVLAVFEVSKKFTLFLLKQIKVIAIETHHQGLAAIARWRKRRFHQLRRAEMWKRLALLENNKQAAIQFKKDCADDQRSAERRSLQLKAKFAEQELIADLEHRAEINRAIRAKAPYLLAQNLERVESPQEIRLLDESQAKRKNGGAPPLTASRAEASARSTAGNLN
jgi:hypothetical protein